MEIVVQTLLINKISVCDHLAAITFILNMIRKIISLYDNDAVTMWILVNKKKGMIESDSNYTAS